MLANEIVHNILKNNIIPLLSNFDEINLKLLSEKVELILDVKKEKILYILK